MKRVVIIGGGTGGAVTARRLLKASDHGEFEVVVIDPSPWHEYRPSYLWVMTGKRKVDQIRRPLKALERFGVRSVEAAATTIDPEVRTVATTNGAYEYDFLVVSPGAALKQDPQLAGLEAPWEADEALVIRKKLESFEGGRVLVGPVAYPYRCPPAPFEVAFMLRYLADQRHVSRKTEVTVFHPWTKPMQTFGPVMVDGFSMFLDQYRVGFEGGFELESHEAETRVLRAKDGRSLEYDLAVVIPEHEAPAVVRESPLAGSNGYMDVELPSMTHPRYDNIFGIGDVVAPSLDLGMAGVFAHLQADHVATQIIDRSNGTYLGELYNMVGVCVMDMGYIGAAVWCDFTDKLYGRSQFPDCRMLGGMRAFRAVKVGFEKYWFGSLFGG